MLIRDNRSLLVKSMYLFGHPFWSNCGMFILPLFNFLFPGTGLCGDEVKVYCDISNTVKIGNLLCDLANAQLHTRTFAYWC
jgi:hypothetical protein